jgi:hypothetical protein
VPLYAAFEVMELDDQLTPQSITSSISPNVTKTRRMRIRKSPDVISFKRASARYVCASAGPSLRWDDAKPLPCIIRMLEVTIHEQSDTVRFLGGLDTHFRVNLKRTSEAVKFGTDTVFD